MSAGEVARVVADILHEHQWSRPKDFPNLWAASAHRNHKYHGSCGVCRGDVGAIAAVVGLALSGQIAGGLDANKCDHLTRPASISDQRALCIRCWKILNPDEVGGE